MNFSERMKELFDQGLSASKDFASKAGAKAQDLGERGIMMLEMKQLENQAGKLVSRLGNEVYRSFVENNEEAINRDTPEIKTILGETALVKETIERKDAELKSRKTNN